MKESLEEPQTQSLGECKPPEERLVNKKIVKYRKLFLSRVLHRKNSSAGSENMSNQSPFESTDSHDPWKHDHEINTLDFFGF
jgi:hypothetical protein